MKFPFSITNDGTREKLDDIGRTARKTLCKKIVQKAEYIRQDFENLTIETQEKYIKEVSNLFWENTNCNYISEILIEMKKIYESTNSEYSIYREYSELRKIAHEEYSKAESQNDKIRVARMFETLRKMYFNIQDAINDSEIIKAVYANDKTFEKQVIENEGW